MGIRLRGVTGHYDLDYIIIMPYICLYCEIFLPHRKVKILLVLVLETMSYD